MIAEVGESVFLELQSLLSLPPSKRSLAETTLLDGFANMILSMILQQGLAAGGEGRTCSKKDSIIHPLGDR